MVGNIQKAMILWIPCNFAIPRDDFGRVTHKIVFFLLRKRSSHILYRTTALYPCHGMEMTGLFFRSFNVR